jgi:hypothetical protein
MLVLHTSVRLHVAELFVPELRKVAAGRSGPADDFDEENKNVPNGGAPRTVFGRD